MSTALTNIENEIFSYEQRFNAVNKYKIGFKREASFALQLLKGNDYLLGVAQKNPDSLENAISNLAAIGISLNPATKESYLVPRGGAVCLDISAIGLIKLATDSGSIKWAQAKLVYENDEFIENSIGEAPTHRIDRKKPRGKVTDVYVVAKTHDGDFLTEIMTIEECHEIRDRSEAWKAFIAKKTKSCPWQTDEGEMMKKTVIKRAQKYWPKSERVDEAIHLLNEFEGIDFSKERTPHVRSESMNASAPDETQMKDLSLKLLEAKRTEAELLTYLKGRFPKDALDTLTNLSGAQYLEAMSALDSIIEKTKKAAV